jgi:thioredoxin reductase (NADPH)
VTLVVRGATLADTMSEYLITEIAAHPTIAVRLRTEISGGGGRHHLERLELRNRDTGAVTVEEASALFVMIGADAADRVAGRVRGTRTSRASSGPADPACRWRRSVPGVFAAGDVRAGSVKRVASAVGEGATSIQQIHRYLA